MVSVASTSWRKWLAGALFAVLACVSLGHHRYYLPGDAGLNFRQHVLLEEDYFEDNLEAWQQADSGEAGAPVRHVRLLEGGFPFLLLLVRQLGLRPPFLVNAVLLSGLLLLLAGCVHGADSVPRRRFLGAVLALLWLLHGPGARLIWSLALPYRDTLSHTLGFAGLALLFTVQSPERAARRVFGAGLLIGLCGWARLSGFLFAAPAAVLVLAFPELGPFRRRLGLMLWLGAGISLGVGLVVAQNILEGRHALMPPQGEALLFRKDFRAGSEGLVRKGWHPLNLPHVLPKVWWHVRAMHAGWLNGLALAGTAGWILATRRQARRLLPLVAGLAVYLLFYGSYDKVLTRYLAIILLFAAAIAGVAGAWIADALVQGLARLRGFHSAVAPARTVLLLAAAAGVVVAALQSQPDWRRAQGEWKDARRFQAWLAASVPENAEVWSNDQALENWIVYFGGPRDPWPMNLLNGRTIDPQHVKLPAGPAYVLAPFWKNPEDYFRGWTHDALLNRFDLEPCDPPVFFRALELAGARLVRVTERRATEREVAVKAARQSTRTLGLILRGLPPEMPNAEVVLSSPDWPHEWPVRLQAGVNLLVAPEDFSVRPEQIRMQGGQPLPPVLDAAWLAGRGVRVRFRDVRNLITHLQQIDGYMIEWDGYPRWWRDWNEYGDPYVSWPRVLLEPNARVRLPALSGAAGRQLIVRLSGSAVGRSRAALERVRRLRFRFGPDEIAPAITVRNPGYRYEEMLATDVELEVRLDPAQAEAAGWLAWVFPEAEEGVDRDWIFLHQAEFVLEDPDHSPAPSPGEWRVPQSRWLRWGFPLH